MSWDSPSERIFAYHHGDHDAYWCSQGCLDSDCQFGPCCDYKQLYSHTEYNAIVAERDTALASLATAEARIRRDDESYSQAIAERDHADYALSKAEEENVQLRASLAEAQRQRDRVFAALEDAAEGMEDMVGYVSDYFREKWGHDEYVERAAAAIGLSIENGWVAASPTSDPEDAP